MLVGVITFNAKCIVFAQLAKKSWIRKLYLIYFIDRERARISLKIVELRLNICKRFFFFFYCDSWQLAWLRSICSCIIKISNGNLFTKKMGCRKFVWLLLWSLIQVFSFDSFVNFYINWVSASLDICILFSFNILFKFVWQLVGFVYFSIATLLDYFNICFMKALRRWWFFLYYYVVLFCLFVF